jgi:hypothetical protein
MRCILPAGNYPNLTHLKLYKFDQNTALEYFQSKYLLSFSLILRPDYLDDSAFAHIFKQHITDLILVFNDHDSPMTSLKDYTISVYTRILILFENLQHLNIHGSSIATYPGLSLCDLSANTFSSSILTKLCINLSTFDDCLYLLDGRLNQLTILIVRIYNIGVSSLIVHKTVN